jgi:hypothetical protein
MHVAASDFRVDLSLHFLSLLVAGAITLALVWYLVVILTPPRAEDWAPAPIADSADVGPPAWVALDAVPPLRPTAVPTLGSEVVTVFRCDAQGRVTYTDHPCEHGGERVLRLPLH